jgi:predicted GNAT family acetyltransferase
VFWKIFTRSQQKQQKMTTGRFELERDGEVAYLEYSLAGKVLALIHTEVPEKLRGQGLSSTLAENALQWARENHLQVDVICPSVEHYLADHPEYNDLILR